MKINYIFVNTFVNGRLIDVGCGIKPHRSLLRQIVTEHNGGDHELNRLSKDNFDLKGTAYSIPTPDSSFDSTIFTFILECLGESENGLHDCNRVLEAGRMSIYGLPFIWSALRTI
jgi:ubiquinone/menaquinone biosynthesis C-methylase UbiE